MFWITKENLFGDISQKTPETAPGREIIVL